VLVNVISTATSAQFSFTLGKYVNTSFKFNMPNGVANTFALTSVDFLDVQGKDSIFYIGGVWTLNNIYVQ